MKTYGEPGPGKGRVSIKAMTACDCGCGLGARFEFRIEDGPGVAIDDPVAIRSLIDEMEAGFELLWPAVATTPTARQLAEAVRGRDEIFVSRFGRLEEYIEARQKVDVMVAAILGESVSSKSPDASPDVATSGGED
jgi:hypothetical protein